MIGEAVVVALDAGVVSLALVSCDGAKKVAWVDSQVNFPLTGPVAVKPVETQALVVSLKNLHAASLLSGTVPMTKVNFRGCARFWTVSFFLSTGSPNSRPTTCEMEI